jgi:hypothetical protein
VNGSTSHSGCEEVDATVLVEGGPPGLAHAADTATFGGGERVKIPYLGGYEHYERVEAAGGADSLVYRWIYRTAVAE